MNATVLTALDPDWEGHMVEIVGRLPGVVVGRRCADLADLLAAASAGHGDVALVSGTLRGLDRDAIRHLVDHGVRVVGASRDGDEAPERALRQLGISQHVHLGTTHEDLVESLTSPTPVAGVPGVVLDPEDEAAADLSREDPPSPAAGAAEDPPGDATPGDGPGTVVAVWGPIGAPGRSTLAVNLASELAASGTSALLIDLDTYGASVAQLLSVLDEAPGIAAAARASELGTLDLPALAGLAVEVAPRFRVLTGIPTASRWTEMRPGAVEQIIDLARSLSAVVVIDCGFNIEDDEELSYDTLAPRRNATTLVALAEADELFLVGAADPVGLQRMVRAAQAVGQVPSPRPKPIVNKLRAASVGPDPRRRVTESLERFAGLDGVAFIPDDPAAADTALLSGRTLVECAPDSGLRLAIAEIAAVLTGRAPARRGPRRWPFRSGAVRSSLLTSHPDGRA